MTSDKPVSNHDPDHVWIFTFGLRLFSRPARFIRVRGTYGGARREMIRRFGTRWAFQYVDEEEAGVRRWGLEEITEEQAGLLGMLAAVDRELEETKARLHELQAAQGDQEEE